MRGGRGEAPRPPFGVPLLGISERFSRFLAHVWPHTALVIFARECTGRPRKVSGDPEIVGTVSIAELEVVRDGRDRRNRAIVEALGISESTVKFHVAAVLRKLGVASRSAIHPALTARPPSAALCPRAWCGMPLRPHRA